MNGSASGRRSQLLGATIFECLDERGLANKRLGLEQDHHALTIGNYLHLKEFLPDATLCDAPVLVPRGAEIPFFALTLAQFRNIVLFSTL